jgi:hypothetical protein
MASKILIVKVTSWVIASSANNHIEKIPNHATHSTITRQGHALFSLFGLLLHLKTQHMNRTDKSIHLFFENIGSEVEHVLRTQHRKLEDQYFAFSYEVKTK